MTHDEEDVAPGTALTALDIWERWIAEGKALETRLLHEREECRTRLQELERALAAGPWQSHETHDSAPVNGDAVIEPVSDDGQSIPDIVRGVLADGRWHSAADVIQLAMGVAPGAGAQQDLRIQGGIRSALYALTKRGELDSKGAHGSKQYRVKAS